MASRESASIRCLSQRDPLVSRSGLANPTAETGCRIACRLAVTSSSLSVIHVADAVQRIRCKHRQYSLIIVRNWVDIGSQTSELHASGCFRMEVAHRFRSSQITVVNAEALELPEQVFGQDASGTAIHIAQLRIEATPAILSQRATVV